MEKKVSMRDQNNEQIIELTIQCGSLEDIKESAKRWGLVHNSMNDDITKQAHGFEIDGEFYELEGAE